MHEKQTDRDRLPKTILVQPNTQI